MLIYLFKHLYIQEKQTTTNHSAYFLYWLGNKSLRGSHWAYKNSKLLLKIGKHQPCPKLSMHFSKQQQEEIIVTNRHNKPANGL